MVCQKWPVISAMLTFALNKDITSGDEVNTLTIGGQVLSIVTTVDYPHILEGARPYKATAAGQVLHLTDHVLVPVPLSAPPIPINADATVYDGAHQPIGRVPMESVNTQHSQCTSHTPLHSPLYIRPLPSCRLHCVLSPQ